MLQKVDLVGKDGESNRGVRLKNMIHKKILFFDHIFNFLLGKVKATSKTMQLI